MDSQTETNKPFYLQQQSCEQVSVLKQLVRQKLVEGELHVHCLLPDSPEVPGVPGPRKKRAAATDLCHIVAASTCGDRCTLSC
jgi:hypothetical protein